MTSRTEKFLKRHQFNLKSQYFHYFWILRLLQRVPSDRHQFQRVEFDSNQLETALRERAGHGKHSGGRNELEIDPSKVQIPKNPSKQHHEIQGKSQDCHFRILRLLHDDCAACTYRVGTGFNRLNSIETN